MFAKIFEIKKYLKKGIFDRLAVEKMANHMAILKMKLVNVVGPISAFEHTIDKYILNKDINLENALDVLTNVRGLYPYLEENPYVEIKSDSARLLGAVNVPLPEKYCEQPDDIFGVSEMEEFISGCDSEIEDYTTKIAELNGNYKENLSILEHLDHISQIDMPLEQFFHFEFMKFRFGKLPAAGYRTLETYIDDLQAFFVVTKEEKDYVWGVYFMPEYYEEKVDAVFSSLYFERIRISDKVCGTPAEEENRIEKENEDILNEIATLEKHSTEALEKKKNQLISIYQMASKYCLIADIKRYAAHTKDAFYFVGWMSEDEVVKIQEETNNEKKIMVIVEGAEDNSEICPPTKLRNLPIFRPFESLIKMYGLPAYNEIDPTPFVAITYFIMFGIMFGDVGQGVILILGGFAYYKWKKQDMGAIVGTVGISSIMWGFVYGSVFGNEEILPHLISPMHSINTILISAVGFGIVLISVAIFINILNGIKNRDWARVLIGQNGLSGLLFYWSALAIAVAVLTNVSKTAAIIIGGTLIAISLVVILLKEPLTHLMHKKKDWMPKQKGMFLVESFFELFEIVLSYVTNTMSFIRVGAFALNHAGMMMVVFIFADMAGAGGSIFVHILGNILVMALETLIVCIQVMRLEFYEMFSRFFAGDGKEFVSIKQKN